MNSRHSISDSDSRKQSVCVSCLCVRHHDVRTYVIKHVHVTVGWLHSRILTSQKRIFFHACSGPRVRVRLWVSVRFSVRNILDVGNILWYYDINGVALVWRWYCDVSEITLITRIISRRLFRTCFRLDYMRGLELFQLMSPNLNPFPCRPQLSKMTQITLGMSDTILPRDSDFHYIDAHFNTVNFIFGSWTHQRPYR